MIRGTNAGAVMLLALAAANAQGAGVRRAVVLEEAKGAGPQAYCATLDASDFANTAAGLRGMHLLADGAPAPFAITESKQERNASESARIEDLREENGQLRFTLIMPPHAYTALNFKLKLKDFVVLAEIAGGANSRQFRLFDLSHEHLGRQTVVQLPEMRDEKLQVTLRSVDKPLHGADVEGVDVLPDRIAQVIYTPVYHVQRQDSLSLSGFIKGGDETEAYFLVDAHVPVKRVHFEWDAKAKNFLRHIRIEAWPVTDANDVEEVEGAISSTHRMESGVMLSDEQHDVAMTLGANLQQPAQLRVIVEGDGDERLPLKDVFLEMRQHAICFYAKKNEQIVVTESDEASAMSDAETFPHQGWTHARPATLEDGPVSQWICGGYRLAQPKSNWTRRMAWGIGLVGMVAVIGLLRLGIAKRGVRQ